MKLEGFEICREKDGFPSRKPFSDVLYLWGKKFAEKSLQGSLSYRYGLGFVVTSADSNLKDLSEKDLVFVKTCDRVSKKITVCGEGKLPESAFIHAIVFEDRSGAIFSFFASSEEFLSSFKAQKIPVIENSEDLEPKLGLGNLFILKGQGALSFGCTADDAGLQFSL